MRNINIGHLSELTGVRIDTIRYVQLGRVKRGLRMLIAACPGMGELVAAVQSLRRCAVIGDYQELHDE